MPALPLVKPRLSKRMAEQHEFCRPADYAREVEALEDERDFYRNRAHDMKHLMVMQAHEVQEQEARIAEAKTMLRGFIDRGEKAGDVEYVASKVLAFLKRPLGVWPEDVEALCLRELREAYDALARKHQQVCVELARRITEDNDASIAKQPGAE